MWRRKVKLLLITGDDSAIEQLVPGLAAQQWLEGQGTVLIYGGSLQAELIREKFLLYADYALGGHWMGLCAYL